jgi:hypothetical protein
MWIASMSSFFMVVLVMCVLLEYDYLFKVLTLQALRITYFTF